MINFFQIAPNDQSIFYLGQIFGYVGSLLPASGASMLLGAMFKTFNVIVLAVAAFIVIYTTVIGVLMTANDGEFMGKKWGGNSIWIPIRMVIGIAALVPTPSGYSSIQVIMMWIVVQGIGAADMIWNTALNYINAMGSPYAGAVTVSTNVDTNLQTLFQDLVCQASAQQTYANPVAGGGNNGGYYCNVHPSDPFCKSAAPIISSSSTQYNMGPGKGSNSGCGTVQYCDLKSLCKGDKQNSVNCAACQAQQQILGQSIIPTFMAIANTFVNADYQYRVFYQTVNQSSAPSFVQNYCNANGVNPCCQASALSSTNKNGDGKQCQPAGSGAFPSDGISAQSAPDAEVDKILWPFVVQNLVGQTNFLVAASNAYSGAIQTAMVNAMLAQNTSLSPQLQAAQQSGWIFAGAYYYTIASMNNENLKASNPDFSVSMLSGSMGSYRNNSSAAKELMTQMINSVSGMGGSGGSANSQVGSLPSQLSALAAPISSVASGITSAFMKLLSGSKVNGISVNPLAAIQQFGQVILITLAVGILAVVAVLMIVGLLGFISPFILGNGIMNPIGPAINLVSLWLVPVLTFFVALLGLLGGLLAVYVPLIPYIIFLLSAISWLILVIEAMVAAPLIALGILSPGGQHEILGHAHHAIWHALGLFLRPGLMVFGMMAAMLLAAAAVTLLNSTFLGVMNMIDPGGSFLEMIFFMGAYAGLLLAILNKCFALIHIIPDQVLRWIGGQAERTEVSEGLAEAKARSQGMAAGAGGAASAGTQAGLGKAKEHMAGQKAAQDALDKGTGSVSDSSTPKQ